MGMFDSVNFSCPRCDAIIEVQSKAGECSLAQFSGDEVPPAIAADIKGEEARCEKCERLYRVVADNLPSTVKMALIPYR